MANLTSISYPLNTDEINILANEELNHITYSELHDINDIMDIFKNSNGCLLLYESKDNYGHWVLLIYHPDRDIIEFFDPYAMFPDDELDFIPKNFRKKNDMLYPHLTALLLDSNKQIEYNDTQLQKLDDKIKTCGRWCGVRYRMQIIPIDDFGKMFSSFENPDKDITRLTNDVFQEYNQKMF